MDPLPSSTDNDQPQQVPPVTPTFAQPQPPTPSQDAPASPVSQQPPVVPPVVEPQPSMQAPVPQQPVFAQPQTVISGQSAVSSNPSPKKKGLLIGLIAGGAALVLIGVGIFVWFTYFMVSQADYQAAADKSTAINKTLEETTGSSSTSEGASEKVDVFATQTKEMGELKAVRNDKDIKSAYDKMYALVPGYVSKVRAASEFAKLGDDKCDSSNLRTKAGAQACSEALGSFDAKGWTTLQKLNDALKNYLDGYLNGGTPSSTEYNEATTAFSKDAESIQDDMKSATTALHDAIDKKLTK